MGISIRWAGRLESTTEWATYQRRATDHLFLPENYSDERTSLCRCRATLPR
ncbi:hypothetical protein [Nocardia sp. CNY236]|uniref:hypothetical protein n=1 Tax=Nocardia sp. CNY236 TaxID=1169152 RepID=UPI000412C601|nr:hypothetical protein [Nocardia sp. CNY236]